MRGICDDELMTQNLDAGWRVIRTYNYKRLSIAATYAHTVIALHIIMTTRQLQRVPQGRLSAPQTPRGVKRGTAPGAMSKRATARVVYRILRGSATQRRQRWPSGRGAQRRLYEPPGCWTMGSEEALRRVPEPHPTASHLPGDTVSQIEGPLTHAEGTLFKTGRSLTVGVAPNCDLSTSCTIGVVPYCMLGVPGGPPSTCRHRLSRAPSS